MRLRFPVMMLVLALAGCGGPAPEIAEEPAAPPPSDLDPDDPSILRRPFTAEQIRDEMVPGLRVLIRTTTPAGETVERWEVIETDAESVEIEYSDVPDHGAGKGEAGSQRSRWTELRDHATFPAARARRERATMDTALGTFDGWLYRVPSEDGARQDEFFFADAVPGAPVMMRTLEDGDEVYRMEQFARLRPDGQ